MTLVVKSKEEKKSPHLALTHNEMQSGAANGRNVSLLMKSEIELTDEQKQILKSLLGEETEFVEKASYNALRKKLEAEIKKFSKDRWDWTYVEDFDESNVVFTNNEGLYYVGYTLSGESVVLEDVATPANRVISFEASTGNLLMSDSMKSSNEGVYSLIAKSFDSISKNEKIKSIFKSKHEEEVRNMEQEIQKAVAAKEQELTKAMADLQKAQADNAALTERLQSLEKAAQEQKQEKRLEVVKSVVKDEAEAVALHKSLEAVADDAFETIIKTLKAKDEVVEDSALFVQKSQSGMEQGEQEDPLSAILKARHAKS